MRRTKRRVPLGDPAEDEERGARRHASSNIVEQAIGVRRRRGSRSAAQRAGIDDLPERADVEVVLHVDGHDVGHLRASRRATAGITSPLPRMRHRLDGLEDDEQVEGDRHVLDVEQVALQLLHRVFDAGAVAVADLRPAGQARAHHVPLPVERESLGQAFARTPAARAAARRSSSRRCSTFHSCGSSSSRVRRRKRPIGVTRGSPACAHTAPVVGFGIGPHRAELVDGERCGRSGRRARW